jgi:hypothetical protein
MAAAYIRMEKGTCSHTYEVLHCWHKWQHARKLFAWGTEQQEL